MWRKTSFPTDWLPVKNTKSNFCSSRAEFSLLPPVTTATNFFSKHSDKIFSIILLVAGEYALGFKIAVFPAAIAFAKGSIESKNG